MWLLTAGWRCLSRPNPAPPINAKNRKAPTRHLFHPKSIRLAPLYALIFRFRCIYSRLLYAQARAITRHRWECLTIICCRPRQSLQETGRVGNLWTCRSLVGTVEADLVEFTWCWDSNCWENHQLTYTSLWKSFAAQEWSLSRIVDRDKRLTRRNA